MSSLAKRRAQLAAQLQYAPQQSALGLLLQQAYSDYATGSAASKSAASGVARSATAAIKPTRAEYASAQGVASQEQSHIAQQLAGLGASADPYKASAATESGLAAQLASQERANAVTDLRDRAVQAKQGAAYDAQALRGQLQSSVTKIGEQLGALSGQEGASATKTYLDLLDKESTQGLAKARLKETQRHDLANEGLGQQRIDAAGHKTAGGVKLLPTSQQNHVFDQIDQAAGYVKELSAPNPKTGKVLPTAAIRQILLNGQKTPVQTVYDPATGRPVIDKKTGLHKTKGGNEFPAFKSKLIVNAAFDLAKLGYLSKTNVQRLHNNGLLIRGRYKVQPAVRPLPPNVAGPDVTQRG